METLMYTIMTIIFFIGLYQLFTYSGKGFIAALLVILIGLVVANANAKTYKFKDGTQITADYYKDATKICYQKLTGGKYPGEERGLDIIDICINPKVVK